MGWQSEVYWASVVIMPYFGATGLQLLRYSELTDVSFKWQPSAILDCKNFEILTAIFGGAMCRLVEPLRRQGRFSIFQDGAILDF